jgi:hypothetical protein
MVDAYSPVEPDEDGDEGQVVIDLTDKAARS